MVVINILHALHADVAPRGVDGGHVAHQHRDISLPAKNMADRCGYRRPRQACGSHLIQQRLKQMVIAAVDECDLHGLAGQRLGGFEAAEAAADDDDA